MYCGPKVAYREEDAPYVAVSAVAHDCDELSYDAPDRPHVHGPLRNKKIKWWLTLLYVYFGSEACCVFFGAGSKTHLKSRFWGTILKTQIELLL